MSESSTWFLKKESGEVYGPVDLPSLKTWAEDGRVAPGDVLSADQSDWSPAFEVAELEMVWMLDLPDGPSYGPAHAKAFEGMLAEGALEPPLSLRHLGTGEVRILGESPVSVAPPEDPVSKGDTQKIAPEKFAAPEPEPPPAPLPVPAPERTLTWQTIARERDRFENEAAKWRALFEKESAAVQDGEAKMSDLRRRAADEQLTSAEEIERLRKEIESLHKQSHESAAASAEGDEGLIRAYRDLTANYDLLATQLADKSAELQQVQEEAAVVRHENETRIHLAEEQARRERAALDATRRRLQDLEHSHAEIVQSYRDMNDRYIRMREQLSSGEPSAAPAAAGEPTPPAADHGSRIRLRR